MFVQFTWRKIFAIFILLQTAIATAQADTLTAEPLETAHYRITVQSQLQPLAINKIHSWIVHVETLTGENAEGLQIEVSGGMPQHNHGLPTSPRMTKYLGHGDYLIEGMKFHMAGKWQVELLLKGNHLKEKVLLDINI